MSGNALRRRRTSFVQVPSTTIRDKNLSYRARGVLAYLLDMPDGWDVRSEVIAAGGKEGRDAIRKALTELGEHGYYRLERRRHLTGRFSMGTAVSETPVDQWAKEWAEAGGKAVLCIEQPDGSYLVRQADGSFTGDGFDIPPPPAPPLPGDEDPSDYDMPPQATGDGFSGAGEPGAGHTGNGFSGAGEPGPGFPGPGIPASGSPDVGASGPLHRQEREDREAVSEVPPSSAPPREAAQLSLADSAAQQRCAPPPSDAPSGTRKPAAKARTGRKPKTERTPEQQARFEAADRIAHQWWDEVCPARGIPVPGKNRFPGFRTMLVQHLEAGCSEDEIKRALSDCAAAWPHINVFGRAITTRRNGGQLPGGRSGRPTNLHQESGSAAGLADLFA